MTSIIYKYDITEQVSRIPMPAGATIISANFQDEHAPYRGLSTRRFRIWAVVDTDAKEVLRLVYLVPTGASFDPVQLKAEFVDTIFTPNGLVFHIFAGAEVEVAA